MTGRGISIRIHMRPLTRLNRTHDSAAVSAANLLFPAVPTSRRRNSHCRPHRPMTCLATPSAARRFDVGGPINRKAARPKAVTTTDTRTRTLRTRCATLRPRTAYRASSFGMPSASGIFTVIWTPATKAFGIGLGVVGAYCGYGFITY
jgi:hypothetical protein